MYTKRKHTPEGPICCGYNERPCIILYVYTDKYMKEKKYRQRAATEYMTPTKEPVDFFFCTINTVFPLSPVVNNNNNNMYIHTETSIEPRKFKGMNYYQF